jgi:hypothetical protein
MRFAGRVFRVYRYWAVEVPILEVVTQGRTRKSAPCCLRRPTGAGKSSGDSRSLRALLVAERCDGQTRAPTWDLTSVSPVSSRRKLGLTTNRKAIRASFSAPRLLGGAFGPGRPWRSKKLMNDRVPNRVYRLVRPLCVRPKGMQGMLTPRRSHDLPRHVRLQLP